MRGGDLACLPRSWSGRDWESAIEPPGGAGRLARALGAAGEALGGSVEDGVEAFVDSLKPTDPFPWGTAVGVAIAALLLLAIGGRWWDSKARDQRRARRIVRRKVTLAAKASALANDVLDLFDRVDLANDPTLSGRYRDAAADFREAESGIEQAQTMHDLDTVEAQIDDLAATMRQVRTETR